MAKKVIHRLSNNMKAELIDNGDVILCDIWASSGQLAIITSEEMQALITLYTAGRCPVCFEEISQGDVVCNECLEAGRNNRRLCG